jgi:hypothetical protein
MVQQSDFQIPGTNMTTSQLGGLSSGTQNNPGSSIDDKMLRSGLTRDNSHPYKNAVCVHLDNGMRRQKDGTEKYYEPPHVSIYIYSRTPDGKLTQTAYNSPLDPQDPDWKRIIKGQTQKIVEGRITVHVPVSPKNT